MTRAAAGILLAVTGCAAALLAPGVNAAVPVACIVALLFVGTVLEHANVRLRDLPLVLLHVGVFGAAFFFAVLRDPQMPLLDAVLTFSGPLLVLRCLMPNTFFNDFLKVLVALVLVVCSAARTEGWWPVLIAASYLLVACQAIPVLARPIPAPQADVKTRLRRDAGRWRYMPALAGHHLGLLGLAFGALLYLLVPRPDTDDAQGPNERAQKLAERRGRRSDTSNADLAGRAVTGFPSTVRLGDIGRIKQRNGIAFRAQLADQGQPRDVQPADAEMLLMRARAWQRYDPERRAWTAPPRRWRLVPGGLLEAGDTPLTWKFQLSGYDDGVLFLPQRARRVRHGGDKLYRDRSGPMVRVEPPSPRYIVETGRPVTDDAKFYELRADLRDTALLDVPAQLARELRQNSPRRTGATLAHSIDAVRAYFTKNKFRYTINLPNLPERRDPILAFLETREGHCELFASAACLFLRQMGVPARVAGGLRLSERVGPGAYIARFRNAHAWVEIRCLGVGFVAVDFTPADARIAASAAGGNKAGEERTDGDVSETGDGRAFAWRRPFDYTPNDRRRVLAWVQRKAASWPLGVALALLAIFIGWRIVRRRRGRNDSRVSRGLAGAGRTLAFYARWLRECAKQGHRRGRAQTPREFLRTLPEGLQEDGAAVTEQFERRRYGGQG